LKPFDASVTALRALSIETGDDHKPIPDADVACDRPSPRSMKAGRGPASPDAPNGLRSSSFLRYSC